MDVLHTKHKRYGDTGKYFYFYEKDFNKIVGNGDWHGEKFQLIQEGSQSWSGQVIVWKCNSKECSENEVGVVGVGRRDSGSNSGQWAPRDSFALKTCLDKGINY